MKSEEIVRNICSVRATEGSKDLQIYIHVPFCSSKCLFCDWVDDIPVSQLKSKAGVRRKYVESLCKQIEHWGPRLSLVGYKPSCIYWGGGTPTRLKPEEYLMIGDSLKAAFDLSVLAQHTMESTPNDIDQEKLEAIQSIGVDRLSFGVQSFDPNQLRRAGRGHSVEQAYSALEMVKASGMDDVNIDLISGFPGEDLLTFKKTLTTASQLNPSHISVYSYRATPQTMMAMQINKGARHALTLDEMAESYELAQEVLTNSGYGEYCFNYFARSDEYRFEAGLYGYNMEGDIIGFGAGANSTLGGYVLGNDDVNLHQFIENPTHFAKQQKYSLGEPEVLFPLFGGALMTERGLSYAKFEYLTGIPFSKAWEMPEIRAWFRYVENCGAELVYEKDRIYSADRELHRIYLKNLSYTLNPALAEVV